MNISLPTKQIKDFISFAKFVPSEKIDTDPTFKYIKGEIEFGMCSLVKANNNSFVKYDFAISHDDTSFLIEEDRLNALVSLTKKDKIEIKSIKDGILITDGYYKFKCNNITHDVSDYRKIPTFNKLDSKIISKESLEKINIAKYTITKDNIVQPQFSFIYVKDNVIYSTSSQSAFVFKSDEELPEFALRDSECTLISQYPEIIYSKSGNYNLYKMGNLMYGFLQSSDANFFDYTFFTRNIKKENYCIIKIDDIVNFCNSSIKFAGDTFCISKATIKEEYVEFIFEDKEKGEENKIECNAELTGGSFSFLFNPFIWLSVFQNLPYDNICIGNEQGIVSIWNNSDNKYLGLISKLG